MRKVISDLKMVMKPLKEDAARFISTFLIVGVGFTLIAYLRGGESAFERVFSALVSGEPLYKSNLYGAFAVGFFLELTLSFIRSYFGCRIDFAVNVAHQLRGLLESVYLILAGTCITGALVVYRNPALGKVSAMLAYSLVFLIFYAALLCLTEHVKNLFSSQKMNGDRTTAKKNRQQ
ncbi:MULTISPECIES: hypothetical protein [unclassified Brenneria]|uniref:hypothetical protein n=1 Tax=unclassified Brenneria TaxID=2634434 RepID=UPI0029C5555E|nr:MULTISPECIES: hypothetical protein [unclassified Brenneria]MDX5631173.1 hypothetical protein [Brenneria sp. L3-3Z]MDX5698241.1 hypothetical protein [Brenneria sp. L4-2C]MEE3662498.1 hypothetical protein [Brenneria sp. g21c3]